MKLISGVLLIINLIKKNQVLGNSTDSKIIRKSKKKTKALRISRVCNVSMFNVCVSSAHFL